MKVVYRHYRICPETGLFYRRRRRRPREQPSPRGGMTECVILDDENAVVGVGISLCSLKDNFSYRTGRRIARGRAEAGTFLKWPDWAEEHFSPYYMVAMEDRIREWIKEIAW